MHSRVGVILFLIAAGVAEAQTASLQTPTYVPGRYVSLRLTAPAAGLVRVRGAGVQGIDWSAAGTGSVDVPLLIYAEVQGTLQLTVNGRPVAIDVNATAAADPPIVFDDAAYQAAALWTPGRTPATRQWTLGAIVAVVLLLGIATHVDPKRRTMWTVGTALLAAVGIGMFFPNDVPRRALRAAGQPGWEWVWHAGGRRGVVEEQWARDLRFVPRSAADLDRADPVLHCNAGGLPTAITVTAGDRTVFVRAAGSEPGD